MTDSPPPYPGINGPYQGYASGGAQQQPQPGAWGTAAQPNNWSQPESNGAPGWGNPGFNPQPMSQGGAYPNFGQPSYNIYQQSPPQYSQYTQNLPQYPQYSQNRQGGFSSQPTGYPQNHY